MSRFQNPPIPRHEALAPFSRDHYAGLVTARHLIKAADADAIARRKAVAEFRDAWQREIAEHFVDEERVLLDVMSDEDRRRLLEEHRQLRAFAEKAQVLRNQTDPNPELVGTIGRALNDHIRWEERELFVRLQDSLNEEQLSLIQHRTEPIEESRPRNTCRTHEPADDASTRGGSSP